MLAEPLYPLHARYFVAGDSLRSYTPIYELEEGEEPDTLPERIDMLAEKIDEY